MSSLKAQILEYAASKPEGSAVNARGLLHLGTRSAVDQALSRLARDGKLMRVCQGVYVLPVETRFGPRPPDLEKVIDSLSILWGMTIVPSGGWAANALGLTNQTPVRPVFLTSGNDRELKLGNMTVEIRSAPNWQLIAPNSAAGNAIRAVAWLGPAEVATSLDAIRQLLTPEDLLELGNAQAMVPEWIAEPVSAIVADAIVADV